MIFILRKQKHHERIEVVGIGRVKAAGLGRGGPKFGKFRRDSELTWRLDVESSRK